MPRTPAIVVVVVLSIVVAACSSATADPPSETSQPPSTTATSTPPTTVPLKAIPQNYVGYLHQPTACGADQPDPAVDMKFDEPGDAGVSAPVIVTLNTSCGPIAIAMDPSATPETVNSFVFLAEEGFFDGTVTHRVIPGFMMQAGDPTATGLGGPGYTIPDEYPDEARYTTGVVAMANRGPGTATSQFFILFGDADWLPPTYTIFGEVVSGFETLDAIQQIDLAQSTDPTPSTPLESVFIESVSIER
ncbi:MAG: peptidylprolyl isomerase [Acidimicrobiia bacterium]|nr:peptidylprolyl isomerase [Acidimicrobiia bacterium]